MWLIIIFKQPTIGKKIKIFYIKIKFLNMQTEYVIYKHIFLY